MKTIHSFAFILLVSLFSTVQPTEVTTCKNIPLPDSIDIVGCDKQPCVIYIGDVVETNIKFTAPQTLEHIAPQALAQVLGLNITYPLPQENACDGISNVKCPVAKGQEVDYTFEMELLNTLPAVDLTLHFTLIDLDNNSEPFLCYEVDLEVRLPPAKRPRRI